jgi:EamA domain-containing membrane protein RarD
VYFRKINKGFLSAGIRLGVIAFILSILIDLLLFMWGPMKMSFADYMMDIGLTYLIYPIVTIGFGYLLSKRLI